MKKNSRTNCYLLDLSRIFEQQLPAPSVSASSDLSASSFIAVKSSEADESSSNVESSIISSVGSSFRIDKDSSIKNINY